ncbi:MAG: nitroreductase family protein [Saprospiraceae bacterium]
MNITPEQTNELIRKRRSIFPKMYINKPISKEILEEILENANWAPTHRLTEPWRFVVFQSESALNELGAFLAKAYQKRTPKERFSEAKYQKNLKKPSQCGAVLAICMNRDEAESIPEIEEICSVSCAVQNILLSASAYNIGAYWSSPSTVFSDEMKDYLNLGAKDKCLGLVYMGYHKMPEIAGKRTPMSDKVKWR